MGYLFRVGYKFNQWIGIGAQITPSMNLSDNYRFSYLTSALYLNGAITQNGSFFGVVKYGWELIRSRQIQLPIGNILDIQYQ